MRKLQTRSLLTLLSMASMMISFSASAGADAVATCSDAAKAVDSASLSRMTARDGGIRKKWDGSAFGQLSLDQHTAQISIYMQYGFGKNCNMDRTYTVKFEDGVCTILNLTQSTDNDCD